MIKLHLGCGEKIIDGFVNIDTRKLPGVDIVADVSNIQVFENGSVSLIYCSHVLEHFGRHEYKKILQNWFNLLSKDGVLRISVPDIEKVFLDYQKNKDITKLRGFLWGGQNYEENYHYCGWDFESLKNDLLEIGFISVKKYDWKETEHYNVDDYSQCYLPHMDKENGELMSLNVEAVK